MTVRNQVDLRHHNIRALQRTLLYEGPTGRRALGLLTNLVPSAITSLSRELLARGVVSEVEAATNVKRTSAGRPPVLLQLNNASYVAVAAEIGVRFVRLGLIGLLGEPLHTEFHEIPEGESPQNVIALVRGYINRQQTHCKTEGLEMMGIGVSIPASVNPETGSITEPGGVHWQGVNFKAAFNEITSPVYAENNVNLMAMGEKWYGRGRLVKSMVFVHHGPSWGCGIVLADTGLVRGIGFGAGEIACSTVMPGGPLCTCGKRGCLQALLHSEFLTQRYRAFGGSGALPVDSTALIERRAVDPAAERTLQEALGYLGIALGNLVRILEPELLVLNGRPLLTADSVQSHLTAAIRSVVAPRRLYTSVKRSSFGAHQALIGCAASVFQDTVF